MSKEPSGNIKGLAPSELKMLRRLFGRGVGRDEIVSLDLAREIFEDAEKLRRRVGILISRSGIVEEVCVGTKDILYLPDLGRHRLGRGRLRGLRLIFSDLSNSEEVVIPPDIFTDLEKLRLDMVAAVKFVGNRNMLKYSHIVPEARPDVPAVRTEYVPEIGRFDFDFRSFITALEEELSVQSGRGESVGATGAVLVGVYEKGDRGGEASMAELQELARTAGVQVLDRVIQRREADPKTVIGKGKLEEVVLRCLRAGAEMIIFDRELRPSQWRAIINLTDLKIIDRSMLILDIFAQHAKSSDGRLQVELAQLKYTLPRLVEKDSGLSRLTGGIGGRGPGETKLEVGRRRIRDRIVELEKRINKLGAERQLRRGRRKERELPLVAILGYTNVGKSTLFNALTGSGVLVENKLFATLDPAQRRVVLPMPKVDGDQNFIPPSIDQRTVILSDTVGFIRHLPAELTAAFRATLEQLNDAVLLLHVLDAAEPQIKEQKQAVEKILSEISLSRIPVLNVINKTDLVDKERSELLAREFDAVSVSARAKTGLDDLLRAIEERLAEIKKHGPDRPIATTDLSKW